jgi:hypothetical protein
MISRRFIKIVGWTAVAGMSLLPINVAIAFAYKLFYDVPFVAEDVMGIAAALFGIVAATTIYRTFLEKLYFRVTLHALASLTASSRHYRAHHVADVRHAAAAKDR